MTHNNGYISDTQIKCLICGDIRRELTHHLSIHECSVSEYREQFPDAPTISEATSKKRAAGIKIAINKNPPRITEETRKKVGEASRRMHARKKELDPEGYLAKQQATAAKARAAKGENYRHSEETLEKMRTAIRPKPKPMTEETKEKLSKSRRGKTFSPHSDETIKKMHEAWVRRKANTQEYDEYRHKISEQAKTPERRAIVRNSVVKSVTAGTHNGKSKDTSLERRFERYLQVYGITYTKQKVIEDSRGAFAYDFLLLDMNIIVEVDGEWWHSASREVLNRDLIKERLAQRNGFEFLRISDRDWQPELIFADIETRSSYIHRLMDTRRAFLAEKENE